MRGAAQVLENKEKNWYLHENHAKQDMRRTICADTDSPNLNFSPLRNNKRICNFPLTIPYVPKPQV